MDPLLVTKFFVPPVRAGVVRRARLTERLNENLRHRLTLISAPAGFGKTTLLSEWISGCQRRIAWFSVDEQDNDPVRFWSHCIASLQTLADNVGAGAMSALLSPQPPRIESVLTSLLNEIASSPKDFILVLDDYHAIDSKAIDTSLTFLIEKLPPNMHLTIATREDPNLPLVRLRSRGQLIELRVKDLRFTTSEAAEFLNTTMGLHLTNKDIAALEARTEGWIAGLQLAALSMQGIQDTAGFIQFFTGSHHFVLDYLLEEVLQKQPENIQSFLLQTSILERMCGPLCDALLLGPSASGKKTLEYLERANLFVVPLDNERRWYRYHQLFADLLRQRLNQGAVFSATDNRSIEAELHIRASQWYEDNGLELEAFHHAAAGQDVERASRLIQGKGMPLHLRGGLFPVLNWFRSLTPATLDARPVLWVMYAGALIIAGKTTEVEQKLQAAENALQGAKLDIETRDILGRIANNRATLAITRYEPDTTIIQAQRALEYLRPDNLSVRAINTWNMGAAYQMKGERDLATRAFTQALSISQTIGHVFVTQLATISLGAMQEVDNKLYLAAETYRRSLQLFGDQPLPITSEAHLGLARIFYEWNDLDAAEQYGQQSLQLAHRYDRVIDRSIMSEVFLSRLKLARGDLAGASAMLAEVEQSVRQNNFVQRISDVVSAQVLTLLREGNISAAAHLVQTHDFPLSQARVHLARGDVTGALSVLNLYRQKMEEKRWVDECIKTMILQTVALHANGEKEKALRLVSDVLASAEPGGFIRAFLDEGAPMAYLLSEAASHGIMPDYTGKLLAEFKVEEQKNEYKPRQSTTVALGEPLSQRELEVLRLVALGLSNREIAEKLFLALDTVKGHNRIIFGKLQVQRRTEAVARARELGLL